MHALKTKNRFDNQVTNLYDLFNVDARTDHTLISSLPFVFSDITAGTETELQTVVIGTSKKVDLPLSIAESSFFKNIITRSKIGEAPQNVVSALEEFLDANTENIWENSWVRFDRCRLTSFADATFLSDLRADKSIADSPYRADKGRFSYISESGSNICRVPVSYLLKLALADCLSNFTCPTPFLRKTGEELMGHFLNDNTSPETFSFHVISTAKKDTTIGASVAKEKSKRFLLTSLLAEYANVKFGLREDGQEVIAYCAPHPPVRQQKLNDIVSDSFYRELFMSPCLSGWKRGEEKNRYMELCHQTLSRSQLNAVIKLKEAGIITNNLIVLPNTSNISLANNGTHLTFGSKKITSLLADPSEQFSTNHEKQFSDLAIKIVEHFLPLFVGTYSAAPYRLDFTDFHPEKILGFLSHELDFTHLRMIWRRWKKKADIKILGRPLTPFGPLGFDKLISKSFDLRGDFITDYRVINYLIALLSTPESPALNGQHGNIDRLKNDLSTLGIFDNQMSVYLLYRAREYNSMGFSGFEGRHYSLFADLSSDLKEAADFQALLTAFAYKLIITGVISHNDIPDDPTTESERRQIFFETALNLPTFFVRKNTPNTFMRQIMPFVSGTRISKRYKGYTRFTNREYRLGLIGFLRHKGADLIEAMGMQDGLAKLEQRILEPVSLSAHGKLTSGILEKSSASSPMELSAEEFNTTAELYYRTELRQKYTDDALAYFKNDLGRLQKRKDAEASLLKNIINQYTQGQSFEVFLAEIKEKLESKSASALQIWRTIMLLITSIEIDRRQSKN